MEYYKDIAKFVNGKRVFVGIDVHRAFWVLCFYCDGEVVEKTSIASNFKLLKSALRNYGAAREIRFVYEAGFSGTWLCRALRAEGYDCIITPPNLMPHSASKVKTDKRDAVSLATYLAANLLKSVYLVPEHVESDRRVIRRRSQISKNQTRAKNQIKSFLSLHGIKCPEEIESKWSKRYLAWLDTYEFNNESDRFTLDHMLASYRSVRSELADINRYLRQLSKKPDYKENFRLLTSLRGVGLITAMTFLLEIFNFERFSSQSRFASYLGLTPAQYSSGDQVRLGHITRQGNAHLRRVLVESAWTVIRHDPHLQAKYQRIKNKGTNGKKAIVAVAHSIAIRLRRCLLDQTEYVIGVC